MTLRTALRPGELSEPLARFIEEKVSSAQGTQGGLTVAEAGSIRRAARAALQALWRAGSE